MQNSNVSRPSGMDPDVAEFIEMCVESNPAMTMPEFVASFETANGERPKLQQTNYFMKVMKNKKEKNESSGDIPSGVMKSKVVGGYLFGEVLGKGSFGEVYKCQKAGKEFAVKRIDESRMSAEMEQGFADSVSARLNSKFLVRYFDTFRGPSNELYVVMELCPQGDLRVVIDSLKKLNASLNPDRIAKILIQLLLGVYDIHLNKILHRDLKPDNIFIDKDDNVKIGDFGCSKELDTTSQKARTMIGTPLYESPQVMKGEDYDSAADMWALGVLLYELCMLERPFQDTNYYKLQELIITGSFKKIPSTRCPAEIIEAIHSLLSVNPEERPTALSLLQRPFIHKYAETFNLLQYFPKEALFPTAYPAHLSAPPAPPFIPPDPSFVPLAPPSTPARPSAPSAFPAATTATAAAQRPSQAFLIPNTDQVKEGPKSKTKGKTAKTSKEAVAQLPTVLDMKCVLVGDDDAGSSSLLLSFTTSGQEDNYIPTVFDQFECLETVDNQVLHYEFWDCTGREKVCLGRVNYPGTDVFMVLFSITNRDSFQNVQEKWIPEIKQYSQGGPIILVGTDGDSRGSPNSLIVGRGEAEACVLIMGLTMYVECSAKTGENVKLAFQAAGRAFIKKKKAEIEQEHQKKNNCSIQ